MLRLLVLSLFLATPALGQTCIRGTCVDGTGALRLPDGTVLEGRFDRLSQLTGTGTIRYTDGAWWRGAVLLGMPSGVGVMTEPDGIVLRGEQLVGDWRGLVTIDMPGGIRMTKTVLGGFPDGLHTWTLVGGAHLETSCTVLTGAHTAPFVHANGERVAVQIDSDCEPTGDAWEHAVLAATARERWGDVEPAPGPAAPAPNRPADGGDQTVDAQRRCTAGTCTTGHGTLRLPGGGLYTGGFVNGERSGQGSLAIPDQGIYTGAWRRDVQQGIGEFAFNDGTFITGTFDGGQPADGRCEWPNGDVYVGTFSGWVPSGRGSLRWLDGAHHVGQYRNGQPNGQGTKTLPDGRSWAGEWADGRAVGEGVWRDADGTVTSRGAF